MCYTFINAVVVRSFHWCFLGIVRLFESEIVGEDILVFLCDFFPHMCSASWSYGVGDGHDSKDA